MFTSIPSLDSVLQCLLLVFTQPSFQTHLEVLLGWVMCLSKRTEYGVFQTIQADAPVSRKERRPFDRFYNFFSGGLARGAGIDADPGGAGPRPAGQVQGQVSAHHRSGGRTTVQVDHLAAASPLGRHAERAAYILPHTTPRGPFCARPISQFFNPPRAN